MPAEPRDPTRTDKLVGQRIRARRIELEMSQPALAEHAGVTFQQLQKYENGKNRISAGRLNEIAKALGTTIQFLYDGVNETTGRAVADDAVEFKGKRASDEDELLKAFRQIKDEAARNAIVAAARQHARAARPSTTSKKRRG